MTEDKKTRRLRTDWRDDPICPKCHGVLAGTDEGMQTCSECEAILFVTKREKTEYLVLS